MEIVLFVLLLIVIILQGVILAELKSSKPEIEIDAGDFDEDSPYVSPGSPFYTNKYMPEEKKGDK